jgi:hypothetical protein
MVKYRFTYATPESAGGYFDVDGDGKGDYHRARARDAVCDILDTLRYVHHVEALGTHLTVQGYKIEDYLTGASESRTAHVEAHPRLIKALVKKFRESC